MKRGEKSATVVAIMEANRDKSYDVVSSMIEQKLGCTNKAARAYYQYMVHNGKVTGIEVTWGRGTRKAAGTQKTVKMSTIVKKTSKAFIEKKAAVTATVKSVDEIEAIKQKNLETMLAVSAKLSRVRDFSKPVKEEEVKDGEYSPHLDREEELNVLRAEGLIDQVPQYSHLEG
jgi:hypothetical protein